MTAPRRPSGDGRVADRIEALARRDKWYLSAGDGYLWAPPFPKWLHRPGFWDEAHFLQHELRPLFGVALLAPDGREVPLTLADRRWWPGRLRARWETPAGGAYVEERFLLPGGRFCSAWRRVGSDPDGGRHLVAFTAQPGPEVGEVAEAGPGLSWDRILRDRHGARLPVSCRLGLLPAENRPDRQAPGVSAVRSQATPLRPEWRLTPFRERWEAGGPGGAEGRLRRDVRVAGVDEGGLIHLAVQASLEGGGKGTGGSGSDEGVEDVGTLTFSFRFAPLGPELRPSGPLSWGAAPAPAPGRPPHGPADSPPAATSGSMPPALAARRHWEEEYSRYPAFSCDDERLERYFDYRVYGLFLNGVAGGTGNVRHAAVAEGIGYFHVPIAYSAPCHARETRWSSDPERARGSVLNFLEHQRSDGSLHGRIYPDHLQGTDFYHANWGDAVLAVEAVHPDASFRERAYRGLARYAEWLDRARDPEGSGLYDVRNHYETGQEYMSRYLAVDPEADRRGWRGGFRLKGVDVTTYAYLLKRALARLAPAAGSAGDARRWAAEAEEIGAALSGRMWDGERGIFSDVDPADGSRTGVKAAVCFYPLLTDLLDPARVARLLEHLRDPAEFATPVPVPSTSRDDPLFSAEGEWRGKRRACPWNGRMWPMTNSHVVEGLLRQWQVGRREAGPPAAALLRAFVHALFHDGDPARPNCYEHYNPLTGHPSEYRGVDDYQHSWILDLLVRGVAGIEPGPEALRVDPLPLEVDRVELSGCRVRGHEVRVARRGREVRVEVDGEPHRTEVGRPLEIPL